MARLIDRIMENKERLKIGSPEASSIHFSLSEIDNAEVIVIDNVAQYFYKSRNDNYLSLSGFPNIAPPFPSFYMEFRMPRSMRHWGEEVATHFEAILLNDYADRYDFFRELKEWAPDTKWCLFCSMWRFGEDGSIGAILPVVVLSVREDGTYTGKNDKGEFMLWGCDPQSLSSEDQSMISDFVTWCIHPCLLAISFLHCKNVTMKRETPPVQLSKKYQKNHGRPLVSYHILNIDPMKQVLRTEGNSEKTGLKQALHICRGHFKDYSKGGGLFGKYKGLYWWDSNVRGSVSEGIIDKDYAVKVSA